MTSRDQRLRGPARALLVIDQIVLADVVKLALNHGHHSTRVAQSVEEASTVLGDWGAHLVVLDMDIAGSAILERLMDTRRESGRLPVIALTRRGDLKAKLTAFERGVDDILTVPFSRRSSSRASWRSCGAPIAMLPCLLRCYALGIWKLTS
jgi:two-component system OmpR family response regulator